MKRLTLIQFILSVSIVCVLSLQNGLAISLHGVCSPKVSSPQFDDPYSEFRNVRYSNAGLLSEKDEMKLGTQLHREVTKKYNLTDVGLERVERLGQRCARASVRPNILYKFHIVQMKEINGFSLPGGHVYITTALIKMANDNELASVLCHEVGHIAARHSLKTLKKRQEYNEI